MKLSKNFEKNTSLFIVKLRRRTNRSTTTRKANNENNHYFVILLNKWNFIYFDYVSKVGAICENIYLFLF